MKSLKILLVLILVFSCKPESDSSIKIIPVDTSFFIKDNFLNGISKETYSLNGIETLCYVFTSRSRPTEHEMGPWCPRHIDDKKRKILTYYSRTFTALLWMWLTLCYCT